MDKRHRRPAAGSGERGGCSEPPNPCRFTRMAVLAFGLAIMSVACLFAVQGHAALNEPPAGHCRAASRVFPARLLLAERMETRDQIIYKTDSGEAKSFRELEREEKEKEDRSWQMLDRLEIFPSRPKPRRNSRQDRWTE